MDNNSLVQVYVKSISSSQQNTNYRVIELMEKNGQRAIRIVLGMFEADFIAATLNKKIFKRPMPYGVMSEIFRIYRIDLSEIIIFGANENVIFSKIVMVQDGNRQELTIRISDALALAVETNAPIFVEQNVVDKFFNNFSSEQEMLVNKLPLKDMSPFELKEELKIAVDEEDYEQAALIRDELNNRKKKQLIIVKQ